MAKKYEARESRGYVQPNVAREERLKSGRILPVDISFIDRPGNRINSSKEEYQAAKKRTDAYYATQRRYQAVIATAGVLGGLFFLSPNMTGNAIGSISVQSSSFLGAGLFIIGLVAGFFLLKSKK